MPPIQEEVGVALVLSNCALLHKLTVPFEEDSRFCIAVQETMRIKGLAKCPLHSKYSMNNSYCVPYSVPSGGSALSTR